MTEQTKSTTESQPMTDGCPIGNGCKYASGSKNGTGPLYCMYCTIERKRRPCPPGEGCTVRVEGPRPRSELPPRKAYGKPAPHPGGRKRKWDTEKAAELFLSGMRAKDVANAVGVKYATLQGWMRGNTELREAMKMNAEKKAAMEERKTPQEAQEAPVQGVGPIQGEEPTQEHTRSQGAAQAPARKRFLDLAEQCICHDRQAQYGSPEDSFAAIGGLWEVYLRGRCVAHGADVRLLPEDVAAMMALFKIGRMQSGAYKADNYVDAIGYLACAGELAEKGEENDT